MWSKIFKGILIITAISMISACTSSQEKRREELAQAKEKVAEAFDKNKLTDSLAMATANAYLDYIKDFPEDTVQNPEYYYEAVKLSYEAENFEKAINIIDIFLTKYPQHELAPYMLHFKAYYIYERGMKNYAMAEQTYHQFLNRYPEHEELTSAVLFSLEHLGKSDNEVLQEILKKSDQGKELEE